MYRKHFFVIRQKSEEKKPESINLAADNRFVLNSRKF